MEGPTIGETDAKTIQNLILLPEGHATQYIHTHT